MSAQPRSTLEWQQLDSAHHVHPFTDPKALTKRGVRVITRADGAYVWDSDGNKILDGMAGLWCVNVGYGRQELVDAATHDANDKGENAHTLYKKRQYERVRERLERAAGSTDVEGD